MIAAGNDKGNQIVTSVWLTMSYTPSAEEAFASVEYIMRDVEYGSILRLLQKALIF